MSDMNFKLSPKVGIVGKNQGGQVWLEPVAQVPSVDGLNPGLELGLGPETVVL